MASPVLCMSISLDGFLAGPNESWDDNPLTDDGGYLRGWFTAGVTPGEVDPVLRGQGRRLFDGLHPEHFELDQVRVLEGEHGVTRLRPFVRRGA